MEYIFATTNNGKMKEIRAIFGEYGLTVKSLSDIGLDGLNVEENGASFTENALIKARFYAEAMPARLGQTAVLADDSGLAVDALGGRPGVYSARFLGADTPYTEKNNRIIEMLSDIPESERAARFVCAIACIFTGPGCGPAEFTAEAAVEGIIAREPRGGGGFGYDPIFLLPEQNRTTAELAPEEKNRVSHRGLALRAMLEKIKNGQ